MKYYYISGRYKWIFKATSKRYGCYVYLFNDETKSFSRTSSRIHGLLYDHIEIIKEYDSFEEVLIDFPELILL